ncbi:MAG: type II secretion system protein [Opitutaceae bacterium]
MKTKNQHTRAFTLIELLMVIAIIGILAGILIPTIGAVRTQANIAASKTQLSNYVTAIKMFKGEYGYFPFKTQEYRLESNSTEFIEALSGRGTDGSKTTTLGNRRQIAFHSFSESEFYLDDNDEYSTSQLADRFNNVNIVIVTDIDGDGYIKPSPARGSDITVPSQGIRNTVSAYVDQDPADDESPMYSLWD